MAPRPWVRRASPRGVHAVAHLKGLPDEDKAHALLQEVKRHSDPMLQARGFSVLKLEEICCCGPARSRRHPPQLLGFCVPVGDGATARRIALRIRRPKSRGHEVRPLEEVMDTMLHEIAHIAHGAHSAQFYAFLDELTHQYSMYLEKGQVCDAAGFPIVGGRKLDTQHHNPSTLASGRAKSLLAAEQRAGRTVGPPVSLGGGSGWRHLEPREAAAQAAERRAQDEAAGLGDAELVWATTAADSESQGRAEHANVILVRVRKRRAPSRPAPTDVVVDLTGP